MFNRKGNTMKALLIFLMVVFLFTGCAGLQLADNQEFAIKKMARIAGIGFAFKNPNKVEGVLSYIKYIKDADESLLTESIFTAAENHVYEEYGKTNETVIMVTEVGDTLQVLIAMYKPGTELPDINTGINIKILNLVLDSFEEGIKLASTTKTKMLRRSLK